MTLQPIHRHILETIERRGGRGTLQDCVGTARTCMPDGSSLGTESILSAATFLCDCHCMERMDDQSYGITDLGIASLQHSTLIRT